MIYFDDARLPFGRMKMAHMIADSEAELHAFAASIGLQRRWYQAHHWGHYDVSLTYRERALAAGARAVDTRELIRILRERDAQTLR